MLRGLFLLYQRSFPAAIGVPLTFNVIIRDPMAPKHGLRPHPYRSTSAIETPTGSQTCSWYAGPGKVPAGDDPPPNRPILVICGLPIPPGHVACQLRLFSKVPFITPEQLSFRDGWGIEYLRWLRRARLEVSARVSANV